MAEKKPGKPVAKKRAFMKLTSIRKFKLDRATQQRVEALAPRVIGPKSPHGADEER